MTIFVLHIAKGWAFVCMNADSSHRVYTHGDRALWEGAQGTRQAQAVATLCLQKHDSCDLADVVPTCCISLQALRAFLAMQLIHT
jgi:hypothetical protein